MNIKHFEGGFTALLDERKLMIGIILLLALTNLISVGGWSQEDIVTRIVPPNIEGEVWVSSTDASQEYKETWALMTAMMMGNVTPGTVSEVKMALKELLDGRVYQQLEEEIERSARTIKDDNLTVSFAPAEKIYERATNKIFITGKRSITGPGGDTKTTFVTYEFQVGIRFGVPKIVYFDTYDGRARDEQKLHMMEVQEERKRKAEYQ